MPLKLNKLEVTTLNILASGKVLKLTFLLFLTDYFTLMAPQLSLISFWPPPSSPPYRVVSQDLGD